MDYKDIKNGALNVIDIGDNLDAYLDRKTIERMNELVRDQEGTTNNMEEYEVVYTAKTFNGTLTEDNVKEFARQVNNIGRQYIILGSLIKCAMLQLQPTTLTPQFILFSYVALKPADAKKFMESK